MVTRRLGAALVALALTGAVVPTGPAAAAPAQPAVIASVRPATAAPGPAAVPVGINQPVAAVAPVQVAPAPAGAGLAASVVEVTPEQVRIVADVPRTSTGQLPPLTVSRDGWSLPASVTPGQPEGTAGGVRTAVVVLDTGPAMAGARLPAAQAGVVAFADALPSDVAVGLVAGEPAVVTPPTRDRAALRAAVEDVTATDATVLYDGLRVAAGLGPAATDRRLVVIAAGPDDDAAAAGAAAAAVTAGGQRVDLVRFGTAGDGLGQLRRLVTASGGTVRSVPDDDGITAALDAVAATVPARVTVTVAVPPELAGTTTTLMVTVGTGATRVSATLPVEFAAAPSPTGGTAGAAPAPPLLAAVDPRLIGLLVFATLLLCTLLLVFTVGNAVPRRRLRQVEQFRPTGGIRSDDRVVRPDAGLAQRLLTLSDRLIRSGGAEERIGRDLERAGMAMRPNEWAAWRSAAVLSGAVLLGFLGGLLGALLGGLLGWVGTALYRRLREVRRRRTFADQLPDALQLIVGSLRSGFSLSQAIDGVVRDFPTGPLTVEFGRTMAEVRLGSDLDDALERLARRVENDDLAWMVMAVRIQRDTGGNLAEVLSTTVETLRERDRLRRHVRALSAEGRLSGYILVALPFVMAAWMLLVRRDYLRPLWTTSIGLAMVAGAAVLVVVGTVWMARWTKVEV